MDTTIRNRRYVAVILLAGFYTAVGLVFAVLGSPTSTVLTPTFWRRMAWVVSGLAFGLQIGYEVFRLRSSAAAAATFAALASALGAFGLAAAANIHTHQAGLNNSLRWSLIVWPVMVFLPAFVAALVTAVVLRKMRPAESRLGRVGN